MQEALRPLQPTNTNTLPQSSTEPLSAWLMCGGASLEGTLAISTGPATLRPPANNPGVEARGRPFGRLPDAEGAADSADDQHQQLPTGPATLRPPANNPGVEARGRPFGRLPDAERREALKRMEVAGVSPSARALWNVLVFHENQHTGQCNPSIPTLIELTGRSDRTVHRNLRELERGGWLRTFRGASRHSGGQLSNCYVPSSKVESVRTPPPVTMTGGGGVMVTG